MPLRLLLLVWLSHRPEAQRALLCDRAEAIKNGTLEQDQGLRGIHLHIGSGIYDLRFLRKRPDGGYDGLEVELLDELSKRAGFTYEIEELNWTGITNYQQALSERILLKDMITYAYWFITPQRMAIGAYSPYGFLNAMLFATVIPPEVDRFSFDEIFSFLTPFSTSVWLSFLGLMIGTGLIYYFLEKAANEDDYPEQGPCTWEYTADSIFKSSGHITGASGFSPKTWPGKIILMSWTWCIVLTLSAYTANLASFLVVKNENAEGFSSLNAAVAQQKSISVQQGTPLETWFESNYPNYTKTQSLPLLPEDRAKMLTDEQTDTAIFPKFEVDILKQRPSINPRCSMKTIGEPLLNIQAGWMVANDVKDRCTILVRDVLALWFLGMDLDGTLSSITKRELTPVETCPEQVEEASEATRLEIENMLGILSVHACGVFIALLVYVLTKCSQRVPAIIRERSGVSARSARSPIGKPAEMAPEMQQEDFRAEEDGTDGSTMKVNVVLQEATMPGETMDMQDEMGDLEEQSIPHEPSALGLRESTREG